MPRQVPDLPVTFRVPHSPFRIRTVGLALSVLAICIATLRPDGHTLPTGWTFALAAGDEAAAELIQNLLLFIPFGVALALRSPSPERRGGQGVRTERGGGQGVRHLLLAGVALSFTVEFLQQWIPGRDPSLGDIVTNGLSTLLGGAIVWTAPRWLHPPDTRAPWWSLGAATVAAAAWLATGWLFQPSFPHSTYYDRWTPDIPKWPNYKGQIEWATLGTQVLEQGPIGGDERSLAADEPIRVHATAGAPTEGRAPLFTITGEDGHDVFILGVDRKDLLIVYRTRAAALTLARPDLRVRNALAAVQPGDTFTVAARRACVNRACSLGYTIGDAWKLIFFPEHFPPWALGLLNAMWVGGGLLGVGLWGSLGRRHLATGAALLLAAATLGFGPGLVGLKPTPLCEWLGAAAGLAVGWLAGRGRYPLSSLRAPPSY